MSANSCATPPLFVKKKEENAAKQQLYGAHGLAGAVLCKYWRLKYLL